jgi:hypothetical protein
VSWNTEKKEEMAWQSWGWGRNEGGRERRETGMMEGWVLVKRATATPH